MGEYTKTYRPVLIASSYTVTNGAYIKDSDLSTYVGISGDGGASAIEPMTLYYDFSDIPYNAELISVSLDGTATKLYVSKSQYRLVEFQAILKQNNGGTIIETIPFYKNIYSIKWESAAKSPSTAISPEYPNVDLFDDKYTANELRTNTSFGASMIVFRFGIDTSGTTYINDLPVVVRYRVNDSKLFLGETPVTSAYLGNTPLTGIYLGNTKLL